MIPKSAFPLITLFFPEPIKDSAAADVLPPPKLLMMEVPVLMVRPAAEV